MNSFRLSSKVWCIKLFVNRQILQFKNCHCCSFRMCVERQNSKLLSKKGFFQAAQFAWNIMLVKSVKYSQILVSRQKFASSPPPPPCQYKSISQTIIIMCVCWWWEEREIVRWDANYTIIIIWETTIFVWKGAAANFFKGLKTTTTFVRSNQKIPIFSATAQINWRLIWKPSQHTRRILVWEHTSLWWYGLVLLHEWIMETWKKNA